MTIFDRDNNYEKVKNILEQPVEDRSPEDLKEYGRVLTSGNFFGDLKISSFAAQLGSVSNIVKYNQGKVIAEEYEEMTKFHIVLSGYII